MRIPRLSFSESLQLIEVAAIVSATIFAGVQLRAIRLQNATDQLQKSADFALRLNQELDTDVNEKLEDDLDDPAAPILKEHGGKYTVIHSTIFSANTKRSMTFTKATSAPAACCIMSFPATLRMPTKTRTLWSRLPRSEKTTL